MADEWASVFCWALLHEFEGISTVFHICHDTNAHFEYFPFNTSLKVIDKQILGQTKKNLHEIIQICTSVTENFKFDLDENNCQNWTQKLLWNIDFNSPVFPLNQQLGSLYMLKQHLNSILYMLCTAFTKFFEVCCYTFPVFFSRTSLFTCAMFRSLYEIPIHALYSNCGPTIKPSRFDKFLFKDVDVAWRVYFKET